MNVELHKGDCLAVLATLPNASVDAVATDPPGGISFMNREWDRYKRAEFVEWMTAVMAECLRVLKPGGHALVWAIPRTSHWTATAIEDAGFEVRDVITHHYGSGFPKSLDVSKAIDKAAGAEREVVGQRVDEHFRPAKGHESRAGRIYEWEDLPPKAQEYYERAAIEKANITAPATDEAKRWQGWGTALKPASEHWILARRPLAEPNVASQVLATGTGAINIAATRVGGTDGRWPSNLTFSHAPGCREVGVRKVRSGTHGDGRTGLKCGSYDGGWKDTGADPGHADPNGTETVAAWECVEGCPVADLNRQSGDAPAKMGGSAPASGFWGNAREGPAHRRDDSGGASRFFYTAKASATERSAGLSSRNTHPTVKPVELMRWLCRLITAPGGTVLDPFMGSGSTGVAAKLEGFSFIGIDNDAESVEIARRRLDWAVHEPRLFELEDGGSA